MGVALIVGKPLRASVGGTKLIAVGATVMTGTVGIGGALVDAVPQAAITIRRSAIVTASSDLLISKIQQELINATPKRREHYCH